MIGPRCSLRCAICPQKRLDGGTDVSGHVVVRGVLGVFLRVRRWASLRVVRANQAIDLSDDLLAPL
jgi:hypothetical protein